MEWGGGGGGEGGGEERIQRSRPALVKNFSLFIPWGEGVGSFG